MGFLGRQKSWNQKWTECYIMCTVALCYDLLGQGRPKNLNISIHLDDIYPKPSLDKLKRIGKQCVILMNEGLRLHSDDVVNPVGTQNLLWIQEQFDDWDAEDLYLDISSQIPRRGEDLNDSNYEDSINMMKRMMNLM